MSGGMDRARLIDEPLRPVSPAEARAAALTVVELADGDREAVGEALAMLGLDEALR